MISLSFPRLKLAWITLVALPFLLAPLAQANVTITQATAVTFTATEADNTSFWKTLSGPAITGGKQDLGSKTITLTAPNGWSFRTGVTVTISQSSGGTSYSVSGLTVTASSISFSLNQGAGNGTTTLTYSGVQIRPTNKDTAAGSLTVSGVTLASTSPQTAGNLAISNPNVAYAVVFGTQPANSTPGSTLNAVTARIQDNLGTTLAAETAAVTIDNSGGLFTSDSTLTVNAVAGVATFSNLKLKTAGYNLKLKATSGSLLPGFSNSFNVTIELNSPATAWRVLQQGNSYDFIDDQQATAFDLELVGNQSHPVLYAYYDDAGTPEIDTDDFLYLRARVAGSKSSTVSQFSSGYLFLGLDVTQNGAIDLFLSATLRNNKERRISVWGPGSGLNTAPNNTSITAEVPIVSLATNPASHFNFSPVNTTIDPAVTDHNLNTAALDGTALSNLNLNDHFVSIKVPFNNNTAAIDTLKQAAAAKGVNLTKDMPLRIVLATSTQSNSFNSDINGYNGGLKSTTTFEEQLSYSSIISLSNSFPLITSFDGSASVQLIVNPAANSGAVATVTASDADNDPLRFSIDAGGNANLFSINSTTGALRFTSTSQAAGTYTVTVRVNDLDGGGEIKSSSSFDTQSFSITVPNANDITPPQVTGVNSHKPNGHYKAGSIIDIQVSFSEPVIASGVPVLGLATGATSRAATYLSGSGSNTLNFRYTIQAGDISADLDYLTSSSLVLNGGSIRDGNSNDATLTLPAPGTANSLGANKNLAIDTVAPAYTSGTAVGSTIVLNFSDVNLLDADNPPLPSSFAVTVTGTAQPVTAVAVNGSAKTVTLTLASAATSGQTVVVTYNNPVGSDKTYAIQDLAGNDASFITGNINATPDTTPPTILEVSAYEIIDEERLILGGHFTVGAVIPVLITFSEPVTVTGTPTLTLETGATDRTVNYTSGSGTNLLRFDYTVQAGDTSPQLDYTTSSALTLSGGTIADAAANAAVLTLPAPGSPGSLAESNEIVIDTTAPVFSSASAIGNTLTLTYTDSNPLDALAPPATARFTVSVASVARNVTAVSVNQSTRQVILTFDGAALTSGQAVSFTYTDPSANNDDNAIQDLAGNDAASRTATSATNAAGDTTPPTLSSIANSVNDAANVLQPITFTLTFNEAINAGSFTTADLLHMGTATVNFASIVQTSSTTFTVVGTPTTSGTIQLQIRQNAEILDLAGNAMVTTAANSSASPPTALAGSSPKTVTVSRKSQTITFGSLANRNFGDADFTLAGTASSGLPVIYTVSGPARINGPVVTLTGIGDVTLTATQPGNNEYNAATAVVRTFTVSEVLGTLRMNVRGGNGVSIRPGSTSTLKFDGTDLGESKAPGGSPNVSVFSIENLGTGTLTLGTISIGGTHASDFVIAAPSKTAVSGGGQSTFNVTFQPSATGPRTATLSIPNNDPARDPYTFTLRGTGFTPGQMDLSLTGGRVATDTPTTGEGVLVGTLTATPDLKDRNTFALVPGTGDADNAMFTIRNRNQVYLINGGNGAGSNTNRASKPTFNFRVQASDDASPANTASRTFQIIVMEILSNEGDFLIADRGPFGTIGNTGSVLLINKTGTIKKTFTTTLNDPYELTTDNNGDFIIANYEHNLDNFTIKPNGGIWKIDRITGTQSKVSGSSPFVSPFGIEVVRQNISVGGTQILTAGHYLVADGNYYNPTTREFGAIFLVDPSITQVIGAEGVATTDNRTMISSGGLFNFPQGMVLAPNGDIYISNIRPPRFTGQSSQNSQIIRVRYNPAADPPRWEQSVLTEGGDPGNGKFLNYPLGLAIEPDGSTLVVADFLAAKILHINTLTGGQNVFSSGAPLLHPTHIALEKDGNYLVTDGRNGATNRRLIRVDKGTGIATELVIDSAGDSPQVFDQPRGVSAVE
jgi:uncharacterized repeat protein (TIGR02059 family)